MGLSLSVIPYPFVSRLASRGCLLETGLALLGELHASAQNWRQSAGYAIASLLWRRLWPINMARC